MTENKFCHLEDLTNEASVEQFFVARLLSDLGYRDSQIKTKKALKPSRVNLGRRSITYRPDFALEVRKKTRWIVEAKALDESLDDYVGQCASYCINANRTYKEENPVGYFVLTNGKSTQLYEWDREDWLLDLSFEDWVDGNNKYQQFKDILGQRRFSQPTSSLPANGNTHTLHRKTIDEINTIFAWCHQFIYKKDNLSQSAAFMEFVKLVFLKLLSDRDIHDKHPELSDESSITLPNAEVRFSTRWLEEREVDHPNPLDALQFQKLLQSLEGEIRRGTKKRIFPPDDHINLSPETIKGVVARLEHTDLFGIDADLNGRLFETFLNATMRGKDLGQYFTPRSVVKLAVRLANLEAGRDHVDSVIDACCGTGGFLIDVLADLWGKVDANTTLTNKEREDLRELITRERVWGVDVAKDPPLARIARMNMYLHGDGGSSIYQADALDKKVLEFPSDSPEIKMEKDEFRIHAEQEGFDVVITNPPFAKEYNRKFSRDSEVLDDYELAFEIAGGARRPRPSLRSSLMFLERYHDLLKPGGLLVTVIDDSILGGSRYGWVRNFIRERFIVRAIVSLPGDAFQRSKARVKTSLICLEKKRSPDEEQPPVFMYYCTMVGVDDSPRQRSVPIDELNRERARREIKEASERYEAFLGGMPSAKKWTVPPERIKDRMDVKSCLPKPGRNVRAWKKRGLEIKELADLVEVVHPRKDEVPDNQEVIATSDSDELVTHLRVRYDGFIESGDEIYASESGYPRLYRVHTDDIVISHINAVNGAVGVVPRGLDGCVVTSEYTVCRAREGIDPRLVWMLLRSPEIRSDLLLLATGIGRNRVRWENARQVKLPSPPAETTSEVIAALKKAEGQERTALEMRRQAQKLLEQELGLTSEQAEQIILAFRPPR